MLVTVRFPLLLDIDPSALRSALLSNFRSFFIQLSFLSLSAIRSWLSAPTFMVKAVDLQRRSLLLLRLLFMAAPAAAL